MVMPLKQVLISSLFPVVEVVPPVWVIPILEVALVSEAEPSLELESTVAVVPPLELVGNLVAVARCVRSSL